MEANLGPPEPGSPRSAAGRFLQGGRIMHPLFVVFFALCFGCYLLRILFNYWQFKGSPLAGK